MESGEGPLLKELLLLWSMKKEGILGRYRLLEILGLSEGVTRGLLKKLSKKGFISAKRFVGCKLTAKGAKHLASFLDKFDIADIQELDAGPLKQAAHSVVIHLRAKSARVGSGVAQRDAAVRAGAAGATLVVCRKGMLTTPPDHLDLSRAAPDLSRLLLKRFHVRDRDVLIVSFAENPWRATEGALAVAETLG